MVSGEVSTNGFALAACYIPNQMTKKIFYIFDGYLK